MKAKHGDSASCQDAHASHRPRRTGSCLQVPQTPTGRRAWRTRTARRFPVGGHTARGSRAGLGARAAPGQGRRPADGGSHTARRRVRAAPSRYWVPPSGRRPVPSRRAGGRRAAGAVGREPLVRASGGRGARAAGGARERVPLLKEPLLVDALVRRRPDHRRRACCGDPGPLRGRQCGRAVHPSGAAENFATVGRVEAVLAAHPR